MIPTATEPYGSSPPRLPARPSRIAYLTRIARVYVHRSAGPLSFWYEEPRVNEGAFDDGRHYFMHFQGKAAYRGPFDQNGVPLLDYQGDIGLQYNPIAISQYGLARFNRWVQTRAPEDEKAWLAAATWLERQLTPNRAGVHVWMHEFNWPCRELLQAPWYSGLAQGCGVSLLVRAADATGDWRFAKTAHCAFKSFYLGTDAGGVISKDKTGQTWIEEYIVHPPSHILNGFIWALWGVYDYARFTNSVPAKDLFYSCCATLQSALPNYDTGRWSLYELPVEGPPSRATLPWSSPQMLASRYYHQLHIAQLRVLYRMTGAAVFQVFADRWQRYLESPVNRTRALMENAAFKLLYY